MKNGFSETVKAAKELSLKYEFDDADFICDTCGAPVCIDYRRYRSDFGVFPKPYARIACKYCDSEYTVPLYEFHDLRMMRMKKK